MRHRETEQLLDGFGHDLSALYIDLADRAHEAVRSVFEQLAKFGSGAAVIHCRTG